VYFLICSSYEEYFNVLPIMVMADESLFWTRTSSLVKILSMMNSMGVKLVSSRSMSILSSAIIDTIANGSISWCGNLSNCYKFCCRHFVEREGRIHAVGIGSSGQGRGKIGGREEGRLEAGKRED
jgi:hypothetical protein